ncbi:phosphotransferase [Vibrio genomosp. F10 str. 9ZC157]|uniref:Thiamine kinase n=1 Tax=Vibrio genomosp. F10 str. ZF-129 TaxID=1187848 RepID=A0A1E5BGP6_9VIBR|nr:phosphotransferase [Vibrio genomosp. F10]OEE35706.1 thiamine kinase [Vibrio genomosp. F10 str. ZF-129]OEE94073.1 thiamine kinase [Vibrio genomosp. F10 str. 9ZC157]
MARMSWQEACLLDVSLQSLDHFFNCCPIYAQTLTGGLTNRCWKVVLPNNDCYVWRPITPITTAFAISRIQEYQLLSSIESSRLGPKAIFVNEHGLLVEWIEGESLASGLNFDSLLKTMVAIHSLDTSRAPVAPFSFTARVDHYWLQIAEKYKNEDLKSLYQRYRSAPSLPDVGTALCHFDLAGYNMVKTESNHRVIDWEYASIADPRLDLTLSIHVAQQQPLESVYRYCQLREIEGVDDWVEGVLAWLPRIQMMSMLWYQLAYQLWGDDQFLIESQSLIAAFHGGSVTHVK